MQINLKSILESGVKLTPMMEQYLDIKKDHWDTLLFFRMGDFYELFFDDAYTASQILNITLTHRGKLGQFPIPMAGIPYHSASSYIDRITAKGMKVAICEQIENPKMAKGIVKRKVVQIVSPGMPFDVDKTDGKKHCFIACGYEVDDNLSYLVLIDFTTGDFLGFECKNPTDLIQKLISYEPRELILYPNQWHENSNLMNFVKKMTILKTFIAEEHFSAKNAHSYIAKIIPGYERDSVISSHKLILKPIAAISFYICSTQSFEKICHIKPFRLKSESKKLNVSLSTLQGLEIFPRKERKYEESILGLIDKTKTSMGARNLKGRFLSPSSDIIELNAYYDKVELLILNENLLENITSILADVRDIDRILSKISTGKITIPDIFNIVRSFESYLEIENATCHETIFADLKIPMDVKNHLLELIKEIKITLNDEIGACIENGNAIKEGINSERDKYAKLSEGTLSILSALEQNYKKISSINNLKIKFNNVSGYFVEVSKSHLSKVPKFFERKQTLVNAERFTTEELSNFEKEVLISQERLKQVEKMIFEEIVEKIILNTKNLLNLSLVLSELDVLQSISLICLRENFVRPQLENDIKVYSVRGAWHPLVKNFLNGDFISHDLELNDSKYFGLITGPNMAGKTTLMREMAIIQFLSQIGCFVPAKHAVLNVCDFLFSRVGASDDITKGQSTFMVEMSEMAEILRHSTKKSFLVIDEVGRGTSTFDGLSIAYALVEHLVKDLKAITLFSTHYHELISVVESLNGAQNFSMETAVSGDDVQFLYRLLMNGASQSYGIYVAKLAGLPQNIIERARLLLSHYDNKYNFNIENHQDLVLNLANNDYSQKIKKRENLIDKFISEINKIQINNLTPMQAINILSNLKGKIEEIEGNIINAEMPREENIMGYQ